MIVLVLGLLFGAKRIPLLARGLGEGIRNFKGSLKAPAEDDEEEAEAPETRDLPPL